MIKKPLVSILMTSYNREKYIAEAIESVIDSKYDNWELIILDDHSSDTTFEIAKEYQKREPRIKAFVNEDNLGQFANRNKIVGFAAGKYIKYLDSDDVIYPYSISVMVDAMEQSPEAGIGICFNTYDNIDKLPILLSSENAVKKHFFKSNIFSIGPSGCIYKQDLFNKLKGFSDFGVASDYDFNLRAGMLKPIVLLPRDLLWWRRHEDQAYTINEADYLKLNFLIHKKALENKDFPLSTKEKNWIKCNQNKYYARKILFLLFLGCFGKAFSIYRSVKLPFSSFLFALLPGIIRNKVIGFR